MATKKSAGGGGGMKLPSYGDTKTISQHHRMATGHSANVPLKKGGSACMKKGGRSK